MDWHVDIYKNFKKIQKNEKQFKKTTKWHMAFYWVDTCTFKKNKKI